MSFMSYVIRIQHNSVEYYCRCWNSYYYYFFFLNNRLSHQSAETMRHTKPKLLMMIKHIKGLCKITFRTTSLHYILWHFHIRKNLWTAVSQKVLEIHHSPWNMVCLGSQANFFLLWPKRSAWLFNELWP